MVNVEREYKLLEDLSFVRIGGTKEEVKAADIIIKALKDIGLKGVKETFEVEMGENIEATLEVLEPYKQKINVTGYMNCKDTPKNGLEAELFYLEDYSDVNLKRAKGKIVLVNGYIGKLGYKNILKAGAIGFISFNGHIDMPIDLVDLDTRELRKPDEGELLPGVNMKVHDAMQLVNNQASKVKMFVKQKNVKGKSLNVICDIPGYDSDETICFTAHYDSVPFSKGVYDNATGSVCIYELAAYFHEHQPKHNLRFIWCGSEERGLLGSKAYCEAHQKELAKTTLCINVDMVGSILGKRIACATSDISLVHYIEYLAKELGYSMNARQGVYSSDSTPFADDGVPAVSFARSTPNGGGDIHNRFDVIEHLNKHYLKEDTEFILAFAIRHANAFVNMVPREMPQNMKDELDKYLGREKDKKDQAVEKVKAKKSKK